MSSVREENLSLFYKSVKGFSMSLLAIFLLARRGQLIHQAQAELHPPLSSSVVSLVMETGSMI